MGIINNDAYWELYKSLLHVRPTIVVDILKRIFGIQRTVVENSEGLFWIDPISNMGLGIKEDIFEIETRAFIKNHLLPGNIFVDVGANEGFYSVIAAKTVTHTGRVIAIEPQTRLIPVIQKNIEINHLLNTSVVHAAVSDGLTAELEIYLSPSTYTGSSSITRRYFVAQKQKVASKTLETIFDENKIDIAHFIKVDVEGFEPEVIRGAKNLLANHRIQYLFVEFHSSILQARGIDANTLHNFITSFGYKTADNQFHSSGYNLYLHNPS